MIWRCSCLSPTSDQRICGKRTVTPKWPANGKLRTREYLTEAEVERLMAAAKGNRYGHRDATMAFVAFRHGLRAAELVDLRWGPPCTSAESRKVPLAPILSLGTHRQMVQGFFDGRAAWWAVACRALPCARARFCGCNHRRLKRKCRDSVSIPAIRVGAAMPAKETKQQIEAELNASERDRVQAKFRELIANWDQFETRLRHEERKVWQPHRSHHDPYSDRFLRIGMNAQIAAAIGARLAHLGDIVANKQVPPNIQAEIDQINAAGDSALEQLKNVTAARKK
jgi:hypothetical protein